MHDFPWFRERLDVARENGQGDFHAACPVCGGSDPLHVTEKNGKALVKCFSCGAGYTEVVAAIDDADAGIDDGEDASEPVTSVTVVSRGGARKTAKANNRGRQTARGVRLPAASTISPLRWMAERCGLTVEDLDGMDLREEGGQLVFEFAGTGSEKRRGVGEGKKEKDFRWVGALNPPLWPILHPGDKDIVVCEGEADVICLRHSGYAAYSVTKGAKGEVPDAVWSALRDSGVERVRLVFDLDRSGHEGREAAAAGARRADLHVIESRVRGIDPLLGEKDARDVALRLGYPLVVEDDTDEDVPVLLSDVDPVEPEPLLIERLHPHEHTIFYGDGGTGKGVIAANWVAQLTREGLSVLVLDYEYHVNHEWRPRVAGFGGDLDRVAVLQPRQAIWDIQGWLRTQAEPYDYVVVDSVTYACIGDEVEKSVTATKYSMAINQLLKPVLSIAHVTKADQDPRYPFGSIYWSNGARQTISVSRLKPEDPESDRILRNPKTNQRGPFHPVSIDWSWLGTAGPPGCDCPRVPPGQGRPRHLHETALTPSKRQAISDARARLMATLGREPTDAELRTEISNEYPDLDVAGTYLKVEASRVRARERAVPVVRRSRGQSDTGGV